MGDWRGLSAGSSGGSLELVDGEGDGSQTDALACEVADTLEGEGIVRRVGKGLVL